MTVMSRCWRYLFVGITLMTWPKAWPVGIGHCIVCYCFHCNVSTYAAALPHYLGTNVRAEKHVTAVNIGLKTSNDLYTCFRTDTYQMRTRALSYCKELGTCVGCLCMLFPKYAALSNRDYALCMVS